MDNSYSDTLKNFGFLYRDQSALHLKYTWYKVGEKGQIHSKSDCHDSLGETTGEPIVMSISESAQLQTCALCWHLALPDRLEASDALVVISTIVENIDQSELTLKAPWCGPELLGKVVDCVDLCGTQIRYLLERMEVTTHINLQYVSDLLSGTIHNMHSKRDELNKYFTEYAVTQNMIHYKYGTEQSGSTCLSFIQSICGESVSWIYYSWCTARVKGFAAAFAAASDSLDKVRIGRNSDECDLHNENLRDESTKQLHQLFETWENIYLNLVATSREQGDVLVGCRLPAISPKAIGALSICRGYYGPRKQTSICLMPLAVAQWLQYGELYGPRFDVFPIIDNSESVGYGSGADWLETLAFLWDPSDKNNTYSDLRTALIASRLL